MPPAAPFAASLALVLATAMPSPAATLPFDGNWRGQTFPFRSSNDYAQNGDSLRVRSEGGVSLLYRPTPERAGAAGASWSWSVREGVAATDLTAKGGDDRNLALYFVFADTTTAGALRGAPLRRLLGADAVRILVYVWGGRSAPGSILDSPYLGPRGKTVVLRGAGTGTARADVSFDGDLRAAFGQRPPVLLGIAVSADSDDTNGVIDATISNLTLK